MTGPRVGGSGTEGPPPCQMREGTWLKFVPGSTLQRFAKTRHNLSAIVGIRQGENSAIITQVID